jgi:hypothetical protein
MRNVSIRFCHYLRTRTQQQQLYLDDSPPKPKKSKKSRSKSADSEDSAYVLEADFGEEDSDVEMDEPSDHAAHDLATLDNPKSQRSRSHLINSKPATEHPTHARPNLLPPSSVHNHSDYNDGDDEETEHCGLCGMIHGEGTCSMTEKSENLAEYRKMLLTHEGDEPLEERVCFSCEVLEADVDHPRPQLAAITAIDGILAKRRRFDLLVGQPHLARKQHIPKPTPQYDVSPNLAPQVPTTWSNTSSTLKAKKATKSQARMTNVGLQSLPSHSQGGTARGVKFGEMEQIKLPQGPLHSTMSNSESTLKAKKATKSRDRMTNVEPQWLPSYSQGGMAREKRFEEMQIKLPRGPLHSTMSNSEEPMATSSTSTLVSTRPKKAYHIPRESSKGKTLMQSSCVICGKWPHHLVKDCPVVAEGPNRYASFQSIEDGTTMRLLGIVF